MQDGVQQRKIHQNSLPLTRSEGPHLQWLFTQQKSSLFSASVYAALMQNYRLFAIWSMSQKLECMDCISIQWKLSKLSCSRNLHQKQNLKYNVYFVCHTVRKNQFFNVYWHFFFKKKMVVIIANIIMVGWSLFLNKFFRKTQVTEHHQNTSKKSKY